MLQANIPVVRLVPMPEPTSLVVRDTPVNLLRAGSGPALLYLHGAGAGGRWLGFQRKLAEGFDVIAPTHPGHAGAPAAEWIEHISDLAFHYLDLMDALDLAARAPGRRLARRLDRGRDRHLRLASAGLARADRSRRHQGRGLDLSVPVRHGPDGDGRHDLPQPGGRDGAGAGRHEPRHDRGARTARAPRSPACAWNPYLYNPLLRRRLARITTPTLLAWGAHDRLAPLSVRGGVAPGDPRRYAARLRRLRPRAASSSSRTRWRRRSPNSARAGRRGDEVLLLPPDAVLRWSTTSRPRG